MDATIIPRSFHRRVTLLWTTVYIAVKAISSDPMQLVSDLGLGLTVSVKQQLGEDLPPGSKKDGSSIQITKNFR